MYEVIINLVIDLYAQVSAKFQVNNVTSTETLKTLQKALNCLGAGVQHDMYNVKLC